MNHNNFEQEESPVNYPGAFLASEREKRGISIEQVANKLNLRSQVIAMLEADEYHQLPEPVFVQGYIRGYCKYLSIPPEDLIHAYTKLKPQDQKDERYLFQNQNYKQGHDKWLFWMTTLFVGVAVVSVAMWLSQNNTFDKPLVQQWKQATQNVVTPEINPETKKVDVSLNDVNKMNDVLTPAVGSANFSPIESE
jgi:cytoskeleton protein RodZ